MTNWQQPPLTPVPDRRQETAPRRRSLRAELKVPVTVRWTAKDGSRQQENTETRVINGHGCMVLLKGLLSEGLTIELLNRSTNEVRNARVVWCGGVGPDGRTQVGMELVEPDPKFWGPQYVDFLLWAALQTR